MFDNSSELHGKKVFGRKVLSPCWIPNFSFDYIKICSLAYTNLIRSQLIDLDVSVEKILPTPLWCNANFKKWERLKHERIPDRIFIIGNGPSLQVSDLNTLHSHQEHSFAFNKIYLAFENTSYRPTYYIVEDILVAKNNKQSIDKLNGFPKFFPEFITRQLAVSGADYVYGLNCPHDKSPYAIEPSVDFLNFGWGGAVTCTAIQIALYMGHKEIFLLGVDNSFKYNTNNAQEKHLIGQGESNHFHPNYRPIGEKWNPPYENITNQHFLMLQDLSKCMKAEIINCTRGGNVEVFERANFDEIVS